MYFCQKIHPFVPESVTINTILMEVFTVLRQKLSENLNKPPDFTSAVNC